MEKKVIELKPCPFCGKQPAMLKGDDWAEIECMNKNCLASAKAQAFCKYNPLKMAARRWNKRHDAK